VVAAPVFIATAGAAGGALQARPRGIGVATNHGSDNLASSSLREDRGLAAASQQRPLAGPSADIDSFFSRPQHE